jgi:16S rRNA processing protein RimM
MAVVNGDGVALGRVSHLFATASNDVMVVAGDRERLIPFLPGRFVMDVDRHAGKITVDWDPEF